MLVEAILFDFFTLLAGGDVLQVCGFLAILSVRAVFHADILASCVLSLYRQNLF
jgi:hypothetical protein